MKQTPESVSGSTLVFTQLLWRHLPNPYLLSAVGGIAAFHWFDPVVDARVIQKPNKAAYIKELRWRKGRKQRLQAF